MRDMFVGVARYARPYRPILLVFMVGLCFESLYDVALRYSLKFVIDEAVGERNLNSLFFILAALAAGALLFQVVVIGCDYIWAKCSGRVLNDIRYDLFAHLQRLPVSYYRRQSTGDLTARFNADLAQIEGGMVYALPMAVMGVLEVVSTVALTASMHTVLFLMACVGIGLTLLMPSIVRGRALDASIDLRREEGRMIGHLQENLSAQSVIKAYGLEAHSSTDFTRRLDALLAALARSNFLSYLVSRLPNLTFLLLQLVVVAVTGWLTINGEITVGALVAYLTMLIGLNNAIYYLTWTAPYFIDATAGWRRVREVLDEPLGIADAPHAEVLPRFSTSIEFQNVRFAYPDAKTSALEGISLSIRAGEYVAFVGRSGVGKSSIMGLIMRFYEVSEGRILIDGRDVRDVTLASLRHQVGLVSQEVMLFDTTVRENIRLGNLEASDAFIEAAARAAEIHDFIMSLPEGYDTNAGVAGARFSGGERQRIALARALVRAPAILILDEFSSALDPATEAAILRAMTRLKGTCTLLAVTHRLSMAEQADRVIVIRGKRVVESGSHAELVARTSSEYSELWRREATPNGSGVHDNGTPVVPEPRRRSRRNPKPACDVAPRVGTQSRLPLCPRLCPWRSTNCPPPSPAKSARHRTAA